MAKLLNIEGTHRVTIRGAHWTKLQPKDGDTHRMEAVLPGYVTIDGEEYVINAGLMFVRTIVARGANAGRCTADMSMETLVSLGMKQDANGLINPAKLAEELEGKDANFVCEVEEYEGKNRLRVKFVNPPGRPDLAPEEAAGIFAELLKSRPAATPKPAGGILARTVPAARAAQMDDIPF